MGFSWSEFQTNLHDYYPHTSVDYVDRLEREGKDVREIRHSIEWAQSNPEEAFNFLPLKDIPFARSERIRELWNLRLHPATPPEQEGCKQYEKVMVPCFQYGGWWDILEWAEFESFSKMLAFDPESLSEVLCF